MKIEVFVHPTFPNVFAINVSDVVIRKGITVAPGQTTEVVDQIVEAITCDFKGMLKYKLTQLLEAGR